MLQTCLVSATFSNCSQEGQNDNDDDQDAYALRGHFQQGGSSGSGAVARRQRGRGPY